MFQEITVADKRASGFYIKSLFSNRVNKGKIIVGDHTKIFTEAATGNDFNRSLGLLRCIKNA